MAAKNYQIINFIRADASNWTILCVCWPWPAMRYGALEDLADRGWIEELTSDRQRPNDSERKRYYRLTRAGRAAAAAETDRLAGLVRVARSRVKPRAGETS